MRPALFFSKPYSDGAQSCPPFKIVFDALYAKLAVRLVCVPCARWLGAHRGKDDGQKLQTRVAAALIKLAAQRSGVWGVHFLVSGNDRPILARFFDAFSAAV